MDAQTQSMNMVQLDSTFVEEVLTFTVNENPDHLSGRPSQYCMSLERPTLTLDGVVSGMMTNSAYQQDQSLRNKYSAKVAAVLRLIAKSLRHLHSNGVVHGDLCAEKCGKFDDGWKLMGRLEVQQVGSTFVHMGGTAIPPEAIGEVDSGVVVDTDSIPVAITQQNEVSPSIDVWGFGKLAYEVFVGKNLVDFDDIRNPSNDVVGLLELMEWNEDNLRMVFEDLLDVGIPESGADLIASCLLPAASSRPGSMDEVLDNPFWKDIRKYRQSSRQRSRRSYAATSEVGEI
uniref:Protein kinase domain-containing protein n=1 Tax=Craspedostauros australis TaxID=1486917 RepID=A0A7R9WVM7_9STRA|mmetsp:Transcript_2057/g.5703  ORF Transcript_2057/g.5703 Transcript_2057/m.5703 type:complete len:287 (+) Transcript_2057:168-1028(+)